MAKIRANIQQSTVDQLMYQNRHTCCICRESRKNVQIHHIDGVPSNNDIRNLAVLCLDCHSKVTGDEGLGRRFSNGEVSLYKKNWEAHCAAQHDYLDADEDDDIDDEDEEDGEEPISSYYSDSVLPAETHICSDQELSGGDRIVLWVEADEPVDVIIMRKRDYNRWMKDEDINPFEWHEDQYELSVTFIAPRDGVYSVVVCNHSDDDARVKVDISAWQ